MTAQDAAEVSEGDIIAGKYRVDRVIGVGGMGIVVAAHHLELDDRVAIKFLLASTLTNKDAVARFTREARAAVKVKSEHVARVTDVGTMENGAPYMVMEYLEGADLAAWLVERGALPVDLAVDFVLQACEAVAEAHALGIVHRDLKPANLFVAQLPGGAQSVKVLDFGISKLTGFGTSDAASATKTSALMGSPLYMSPEQMVSSKNVDPRSDVWSLGVIFYEFIAGGSPFIAETMPELVLKITNSPPRPLRDLLPNLPEGLETVVLRCLEKDRNHRFQTVGEFATALAPFGSPRARVSADRIAQVMNAAGMSSTPGPTLLSHGVAATSASSTFTEFGSTGSTARRKGPLVLALAGIASVVVMVGLGAFLILRSRSGDDVAPVVTESEPEPGAPAHAAAPPPPAPPLTAIDLSVVPAPAAATEPSASAAPAAGRSLDTAAPVPAKGGPVRREPKPPAAPPPPATVPPPKKSPASLIDDRR